MNLGTTDIHHPGWETPFKMDGDFVGGIPPSNARTGRGLRPEVGGYVTRKFFPGTETEMFFEKDTLHR